MGKRVLYTDVVKAWEMGIIIVKPGYNPEDESVFMTITVADGYSVTDEFIDVLRKNGSELFARVKSKEIQIVEGRS